jgi:hypothetical protein
MLKTCREGCIPVALFSVELHLIEVGQQRFWLLNTS